MDNGSLINGTLYTGNKDVHSFNERLKYAIIAMYKTLFLEVGFYWNRVTISDNLM